MINFPGLNLSFNINQIAFTIFGIDIYYYAICIICGIVLALILCYKSK
jgi:phosphatidylglycerol:prolipoprotein diacylglycerol transferase